MQTYVLYCTTLYITNRAVKRTRALYDSYEEHAWPGGVFSQEGWDDFEQRDLICQIPFSQPLFFMALLLIWTGTCWVDLKESAFYMRLWATLGDRKEGCMDVETVEEDSEIMIVRTSRRIKFT